MPPGKPESEESTAPRHSRAAALEAAQLAVSPPLFAKFQKLIYSETGIWLGGAKTALLCGRLFRRLRTLGLPSLEQYYERVSPPDAHEERALMIDAITTNETRFFREPRQFEFMVQQLFPRWRMQAEHGLRSKRVKIWSAGCSSGEEPYTLAMLLAEHLPAEDGWDATVLATDISNRVLEKARKGIYDLARCEEIPKDLLHKFMLRGVADRKGQVKAKIAIQQVIDFQRLNLNQEPYGIDGPFDAILCRNVLIYFDAASKSRVVANLLNQLAGDGFLFVGHAENLASISGLLRSIEPTIYTRTESASAPERQKANATSAGR